MCIRDRLEESGSWGGKELLWKLEDDQLLEEGDEEELELLEDDELEEESGALLEESRGSGAEELLSLIHILGYIKLISAICR